MRSALPAPRATHIQQRSRDLGSGGATQQNSRLDCTAKVSPALANHQVLRPTQNMFDIAHDQGPFKDEVRSLLHGVSSIERAGCARKNQCIPIRSAAFYRGQNRRSVRNAVKVDSDGFEFRRAELSRDSLPPNADWRVFIEFP
jgi:hypothetical protein